MLPTDSVTVAVVNSVRKLAGTTAVNWLALTKVVPCGNGEPFQLSTELVSKATPLAVSVSAGLPMGMRLGTTFAMAAPATITNSAAFDTAEPMVTVTPAAPAAKR